MRLSLFVECDVHVGDSKYVDSCVSGSMCICVYVCKYICMSGILTKSIFGDPTYFTYLTTT